MPPRLSVGVSKKLGLPGYSSLGAHCAVELELEPGLLGDLGAFRERARDAYLACRLAVDDELVRLRSRADSPPAAPADDGCGRGDRSRAPSDGVPARAAGHPGRPATASQVKAIVAIARRQRADLEGLLCELDVARPEDLTLAQASRLIDQLKAVGPG